MDIFQKNTKQSFSYVNTKEMQNSNSYLSRQNISVSKYGISVIFLAFLIVTLSDITKLPFGPLKMVAILATVYFPLYRIAVQHFKLIRRDFILLAILSISALFQNTTITQKLFSFFFYITIICWAFHGHEIIKTPKYIFAAAMGIATGVIIGLLFSKSEIIEQLSAWNNYRKRIWGAFTHPNQLAAMATSAVIAMMCFLSLTKKNRWTGFLCILTGLMLLVLLATKSRTQLIVLIVFVLVWCMRNQYKVTASSRRLMWILIIILGAGIIYLFFTGYALADEAYAMRLKIFRTMTVTPRTFLVGNGMVDSSNIDYTNAGGSPMEIGWVLLFYKNGIIGVITYLYIFLHFIKKTRRIPTLKQKWLARAILCSLLVSSLGEAFIVNIACIFSMIEWTLLSALTLGRMESVDS